MRDIAYIQKRTGLLEPSQPTISVSADSNANFAVLAQTTFSGLQVNTLGFTYFTIGEFITRVKAQSPNAVSLPYVYRDGPVHVYALPEFATHRASVEVRLTFPGLTGYPRIVEPSLTTNPPYQIAITKCQIGASTSLENGFVTIGRNSGSYTVTDNLDVILKLVTQNEFFGRFLSGQKILVEWRATSSDNFTPLMPHIPGVEETPLWADISAEFADLDALSITGASIIDRVPVKTMRVTTRYEIGVDDPDITIRYGFDSQYRPQIWDVVNSSRQGRMIEFQLQAPTS